MKQLIIMISMVLALCSAGLSADTKPASSDIPQTMTTTPVNINTADAKTLATALDGIGEVKAQAIVAYREANGAFASAQDLDQVKGVGPATITSNQDNIVFQ